MRDDEEADGRDASGRGGGRSLRSVIRGEGSQGNILRMALGRETRKGVGRVMAVDGEVSKPAGEALAFYCSKCTGPCGDDLAQSLLARLSHRSYDIPTALSAYRISDKS
jgi:hypothetical protein